jgi:hypothetical protein
MAVIQPILNLTAYDDKITPIAHDSLTLPINF